MKVCPHSKITVLNLPRLVLSSVEIPVTVVIFLSGHGVIYLSFVAPNHCVGKINNKGKYPIVNTIIGKTLFIL